MRLGRDDCTTNIAPVHYITLTQGQLNRIARVCLMSGRENSTHTGPELVQHPNDDQEQPQQLRLSPCPKVAKGSSRTKEYEILHSPRVIFSKDLKAILTTPTLDYHHGNIVAVSKDTPSYAAKGTSGTGSRKIITTNVGCKTATLLDAKDPVMTNIYGNV
ncbi:MAG: hypothetical protein J3Q66DRAFT_365857 [Benniella sp.]|nr:MAG: hypothetical protein J3Q66DRAFT_365857 [Benniella sp.]